MNAKSVIHVGIALILFGIAFLVYQADTRTVGESFGDTAQPRASVDALKTIGVSRLGAGLLLVGGVVLIVVGARTSSPR